MLTQHDPPEDAHIQHTFSIFILKGYLRPATDRPYEGKMTVNPPWIGEENLLLLITACKGKRVGLQESALESRHFQNFLSGAPPFIPRATMGADLNFSD
jgi:hypothetical protein